MPAYVAMEQLESACTAHADMAGVGPWGVICGAGPHPGHQRDLDRMHGMVYMEMAYEVWGRQYVGPL